ncbi:hypothetical protein TWF225_005222 [Orbilia oligospora]|nr:hypothetical protein TWF751_005739 [Orbilia oligospora]KAF3185439.1 hypothetical protein TWF225_005222 [Orbilia oligospora]KAF3252406.1 hypothetical protein TWF128_006768 [Orbilia oligospora]KAF3258110.1 hypothetical protein TWF217_005809 [Orbilia oligospora]KAF3289156.1 hypothetical protein TWF132_007604 [Orbilia oligospora]
MADPFSIATGVLGILGMAVGLTKSLHQFSTSIKTSSETLLQIRTNTDILSHMLTDLSPVLSDPSVGSHEKEVIEMCVNNCKGNFERIEKLVRPFMKDVVEPVSKIDVKEEDSEGAAMDRALKPTPKSLDIDDTKSKLRLKLRKIGWPFREKETKELLEIIDRTIQHLGLALDTVHSKTSLKVLTLAEYQKQALKDTHAVATTIESHTVEIEAIVRSNSDTLKNLESHSQRTSNAIEVRLQQLEDTHKEREQETKKLLLQLLDRIESSGSLTTIRGSEIIHAVDPLARQIMQKTLNRDFSTKNAYADVSGAIRDPPPVYSATDQNPQEVYNTKTKDWSWETPFGRISIFSTHHQRDEANSNIIVSKDRSASRYKMMFTPAPWLYNQAATFAFIKRVDGFGIQFTTPAIFKSDEPALKYLRRGEFEKLRNTLGANTFLLNAVHETSGRTLLAEAVRCRRYDACKYLLDLGADPEAEDHRGSTLFNLLFNLNVKSYQVNTCLKIFSLLINTRADLFRGKATVMHSAVTTQYVNLDPSSTQKVLKTVYSSVSGLTSIDDADIAGNSPLVSACTYGHDNPVVIDFLLQNGAARDALPEKHVPKPAPLGKIPASVTSAYPAFYATARAGYIASMRRLIESRIPGDPNLRTDYGRTILHNNIRRSVKYNTPRKSSNSRVSQFQKKHEVWKENFEYLVANGADIDAIDPHGWTVLHCAALGPFCDEEMLMVLVGCGVDVDIEDQDGRTAWELAVKYDRVKLKAWRWFGVEMFKRGKLAERDLKGHVAKHLYMKGDWWKEAGQKGMEEEKEETQPQDMPIPKLPDDDEWLFMDSMHPFESEQVFGEDMKLDPEAAGVKYRFPIDEFWARKDIERMKKRKIYHPGDKRDSEKQDISINRTWMGTVGNVLAAFVG